jgi:hypothetical protein
MNTNGEHPHSYPREVIESYGIINHINNNASNNINNNINQPSNHVVAVPQLPSQSSNGRISYGHPSDPRQSGNYNTTSEGSTTSPDSSSESSEEWESGELNHFNIA